MPHLILTVGTGTAGRHSNLAAGLRRTLELLAPEKFWLIPSTDEVSQLTADLVREGLGTFQPWSDASPYCAIERPDSLEDCRQTVRKVIERVRQQLPRGTRLLVNPTSGTKQMSVGAALAALDANAGELVFTVGKRADGVVMTGTEKLEAFDASEFLAERDRGMGVQLAKAGAFSAAATVLRRHDSLAQMKDIACCLHEWERQNYGEARRIAAQSHAAALIPVRHALEELARAARECQPQPIIISDLLHTGEQLLRRHDFESALVLACRALEMGLRCALFQETGLCEPYDLDRLCGLDISHEIKDRARQLSHDGRRTILNLRTVAAILGELRHEVADTYRADRELHDLVNVRNLLMHQLRAVSQAESQSALQRTRNVLAPLRLPLPCQRPVLTE